MNDVSGCGAVKCGATYANIGRECFIEFKLRIVPDGDLDALLDEVIVLERRQ